MNLNTDRTTSTRQRTDFDLMPVKPPFPMFWSILSFSSQGHNPPPCLKLIWTQQSSLLQKFKSSPYLSPSSLILTMIKCGTQLVTHVESRLNSLDVVGSMSLIQIIERYNQSPEPFIRSFHVSLFWSFLLLVIEQANGRNISWSRSSMAVESTSYGLWYVPLLSVVN